MEWQRLNGKYDRNKIWAKLPIKQDYLPELKGKLFMWHYKYDFNKDGSINYESERLVDYQEGSNKVVLWAKIPLAFLITGNLNKIGKAWTSYTASDGGAGRTKGLDGSGDIADPNLWKKAFNPPTNMPYYDNAGNLTSGMLWNPNAQNNLAQFPFYPTKIRLGGTVPIGNPTEQAIAEDQSRLYDFSVLPSLYEGENRNVNIENGYFVFDSSAKYRQFIYAKRPEPLSSFGYFAQNNLYFQTSADTIQDKTLYLSKYNRTLSAFSIKVVLPQHNANSNYCYDNLAIGQLELRCDAGSRGLIDTSEGEHYGNMLDGLVYSIKNIGATTKEANSKIIFCWILYF
ncbi:MAG TPA: hypothetical protein PKL13_04635 [bacterium]|nr:hypothetical protein [bacterium]